MRNALISLLLICMVAVPATALAQADTPPATEQSPADADVPFYEDTGRLLAMGLGAVVGAVALAAGRVAVLRMLPPPPPPTPGVFGILAAQQAERLAAQTAAETQGIELITAAVVGALAGNWIYRW